MSTHRFFVSESSFEGELVRLSPEQAHQVCHVLRLRPEDTIVVLDNSGSEYEVALTTVDTQDATGRILAKHAARGEPGVRITLFQSLLAREKFESVLQKGTEVGVARFVPVVTQRSIVRRTKIDAKKLARRRRILTEAAEQAHRGRIPQLDQEIGFAEAASSLAGFDCALIAAPSEEAVLLGQALRSRVRAPSSVALLIGPEGGFTDVEVTLARAKGAVKVGLGPRILRTETAAVVISALTLYELGQMKP
jgi:16S rRNA (uracil1498-N3)-methyltransferase